MSRALEELRREAERGQGDLSVFSAEAGAGRDRLLNPLFHAKLIVRDDQALLVFCVKQNTDYQARAWHA
jgi:hypothetical protein